MDILFLIYFIIHLPISLIFAPQIALPNSLRKTWIPQFAQSALDQAVADSGDPFLSMAIKDRQFWMAGIFMSEVLFQIPFFIYAIWAIMTSN